MFLFTNMAYSKGAYFGKFINFKGFRWYCSQNSAGELQGDIARASYRTIRGWITSLRKMKDVVFLDINDGSSSRNMQIVLPKSMFSSNITYGTSIEVSGPIGPNAKGQTELAAKRIAVIGECDIVNSNYPFTAKQKHSPDYCRLHQHLRPKLPHFQALLRTRHNATMAVHRALSDQGFFHIHTPILTSSDCEGGGEVFQVSPLSKQLIDAMKKQNQSDDEAFFGSQAFLSVSGQLHLEAVARGMTKVYAFSPTFRAENSKSRLHLSEFYMIETEEAFMDDLDVLLDFMENFLKTITLDVFSNNNVDLSLISKYEDNNWEKHLENITNVIDKPFVKMTFSEACALVTQNKDRFKSSTNCEVHGFSKEQELFIVESVGNGPVFIIDWPKVMKPFYMREKDHLASAVDLLVPNVGELCGGSLRENDCQRLQDKLKVQGLDKEMEWYLDLRKFGNVPTGGFGMGFERFLQLITGIGNIKDTIPFPRWPHSLKM